MIPQQQFCKDETDSILIVEGKDDCNGIYQIAAHHGLQGSFGIWEGGNDDGALSRFGGLLVAKNRPSNLGIVLDCDSVGGEGLRGAAHRWAQIEGKLAAYPYVTPDAPNPAGSIVEGPSGYPRIGVWLMPDNRADGMFEDFLLPLISEEARTLASSAAREAKQRQVGNYKDVHYSKAVAHTYLAWQDEPGRPLGLAIKARMFDVEGRNAQAFVAWLRALFSPQPA